jgi:hypothetical protein
MDAHRNACWRCLRPASACVCALFGGRAPVDNRTEIVILQHPRERRHALGTVRIARLGLARVRCQVVHQRWGGLATSVGLPAGSGLLYPHPAAQPLAALPRSDRPTALVVLDGTWANARRLYLANPWLARLPHYQLFPTTPSQYRIRRQDQEGHLATIEAIVEALRLIEPETAGLDGLLDVFRAMIDAQLQAHASGPHGRVRRRYRTPHPVPHALCDAGARLLLAYGESTPRRDGARRLVQWTTLRPSTGECFERLLRPAAGEELNPAHLSHMALRLDDLAQGVDADELQRAWHAFAGPRPLLAAWNQGTVDLHREHLALEAEPVVLKAAYCNLHHAACGTLEQVVAREALHVAPVPVSGRSAWRLGRARAVLELLQRHAGATPLPFCRANGIQRPRG